MPGLQNKISISKRDGANMRIIILSYEESDKVWLFRSENKKYLFVSDANLYLEGNELHLYGYKSNAKLISLCGKINGEIKKISLTDYNGKWVILFFYPADFTFICPTELGELADRYQEFKDLNQCL